MTKRGCLRLGLGAALLSLVAVLVLGYGVWQVLLVPYQGYSREVFIELGRGTSTRQLAAQLEQAGVIRSRYSLLLWRAFHPGAPLQAGEYHFDVPLAPGQVFDKIRRGDTFYQVLTVPEGSNLFDIAESLKSLKYVEPSDFVAAARNPALVKDLDPHAPSLEGFLFPSSYRVSRSTTAQSLCRVMVDQFRRQWSTITAGAPVADVHKVVTLASLIEKETAAPAERPLIASVFENRLSRGMPLQCDPTVVYAALRANKYRGDIYRSDLTNTDPYNTYAHAGLPPGPIANPGTASLTAALHPAASDYLYFVAKPGSVGQHKFSATLNEHELAVKAYRGR